LKTIIMKKIDNIYNFISPRGRGLFCYLLLSLTLLTVACKKDKKDPDTEQTTVYVAGYVSNGTKQVATLWKDGMAQNLSDGTNSAYAYSVYESDNDVYVAGYASIGTKHLATLWKNGVAQELSDGTSKAYASSVYVSDGDVYVVGYVENGTKNVDTLWKNGVA